MLSILSEYASFGWTELNKLHAELPLAERVDLELLAFILLLAGLQWIPAVRRATRRILRLPKRLFARMDGMDQMAGDFARVALILVAIFALVLTGYTVYTAGSTVVADAAAHAADKAKDSGSKTRPPAP